MDTATWRWTAAALLVLAAGALAATLVPGALVPEGRDAGAPGAAAAAQAADVAGGTGGTAPAVAAAPAREAAEDAAETAPRTLPRPLPEGSEAPAVVFPDGTRLPALNGVQETVTIRWPAATFPAVVERVVSKGQEWYFHADGSWTTVTTVFDQAKGRLVTIPQVFTPTDPKPVHFGM